MPYKDKEKRLAHQRAYKLAHPEVAKREYLNHKDAYLKRANMRYVAKKEEISFKNKLNYLANKDEIKIRVKKRYIENHDAICKRRKQLYSLNTPYYLNQKKADYLKHKVVRKSKSRIYYLENKEKLKQQMKVYNSKPEIKRIAYQRQKEKLKNPLLRVRKNISTYLTRKLKELIVNKNDSSFSMLGYRASDVKVHLEKQFDSKMSWDNYGSYWHIDHKTPISFAHNEQEVIELFQLDNLQPLEAKENISKSDIIIADLFGVDL